jgi:hypothetical protein
MTDELTELPTKLNPLPVETRDEKRSALKARKAFAAVFSPFVKAMQTVTQAYLDARRQGVERADAAKGLEEVLRDTWPGRTTKYPHKCQACEDTGYEEHVCRPYVRCERPSCQRKGEDFQHTYVRPCECAKGQAFNRKANPPQEWVQDSVGKVSKKKGWSRVGG